MTSKRVTIQNELGLHARPANVFVKEANRYRSRVRLIYQGREYNAKSIVSVLKACVKTGCEIEVQAEGEDEAAAVAGLTAAVAAGLGE